MSELVPWMQHDLDRLAASGQLDTLVDLIQRQDRTRLVINMSKAKKRSIIIDLVFKDIELGLSCLIHRNIYDLISQALEPL